MRKRAIPDIPERKGSEFDRALKESLIHQFPVELPVYTYQELTALTAKDFDRHLVECSNGRNGDRCLAYCDGFNWRMIDFGLNISNSGSKAQLLWTKVAANSITLTAGTSADALADLQSSFDGNTYDIAEAAATPGIDLIVDFINVEAVSYVEVLARYQGSTTHSVSIQAYNWVTAAWDTFCAQVGSEVAIVNHSFWMPSDVNYIGTEANLGKVRIRFNHTMSGNASHDLYIDSTAIYY